MLLLPLLVACVDYSISGKDGDSTPIPVDDTAPDTAETGDTAPPPPVEECNGVDDDGDGTVDEDFGDVDADGVADCLDDACALDVYAADAVPLSEACSGSPTVKDPWSVTATNVWAALSTDGTIRSIGQTPLVAQLTDDDGDGLVTAADRADVVFLAWDNRGSSSAAHLVVLDGTTWTELLDLGGFYFAGEMAVGDLDGDGFPELLAYDGRNAVHAYAMDGTELWASASLTYYLGGQPSLAVVDLEGDGVVEVLAQEAILDGATGEVVGGLPSRADFSFTQHVAADLDLDGVAEIVYDGDVHEADGTLRWSGISRSSGSMAHAMVLDVDGDPEGEVVFTADQSFAVFDTDGTELATASWRGGLASVPCAADFDGDGAPEVAIPSQTILRVYELDGTEVAAMAIEDVSSMAGCVGADLDGDGAAELIHADEVALYVFDVRTRTALLVRPEHASGTLIETPSVVDLDGDGAAEILLGSNDNSGADVWIGLTRLAHAGAGWTAAPADWPANARVDGRFGVDGSVVDVGTWWTRENTFRGLGTEAAPLLRDAAVGVDDACVASCDEGGLAQVSVRVANPGRDALPADVEVRLYRVDGGARVLVGVQALGAALPSGARSASLVFSVAATDVGPEGFVATVGEGAADCHPEDNEDALADLTGCP